MKYWLFKSEPSQFSIDDLAGSRRRTTFWDGVRNFQARNFMRDEMREGDLGFFYHSSCATPGIVGTVEIVSAAYPDSTAFDPDDKHFDAKSEQGNPTWFGVDVRLQEKFKNVLGLAKLKQHAGDSLSGMHLLRRGNRLSVMPISARHWKFIIKLVDESND